MNSFIFQQSKNKYFWDYIFVLELEGYVIYSIYMDTFLIQENLPSSQKSNLFSKILVQNHRVTIDVFYFLNCFYL